MEMKEQGAASVFRARGQYNLLVFGGSGVSLVCPPSRWQPAQATNHRTRVLSHGHLPEYTPYLGAHRGRVGRSVRQEGLWELAGGSWTSQGLCRSRLDSVKPLEGSPPRGLPALGLPHLLSHEPLPF